MIVNAAKMRASNSGVASSLRIWPITTKKRGSRERSSPPCQIRTLILPRAQRRAAVLFLDLTLTPKASNSRATLARPVRITSAHHQTVFRPPFMTASAPPLAFMIVNSGTRWLPEHLTFGSKSGRGCRPKDQRLAISLSPSLGVQMVGGRCKRVESSVD